MTEPSRPTGDKDDLTQIEVEFAPLLAQIGRIMTSSEDIDEVYDRFTEAVTSVIPADRLSIVVVDSEAWQHKSRYYAGIDVPLATLDVWHPLDGQVLDDRRQQSELVPAPVQA